MFIFISAVLLAIVASCTTVSTAEQDRHEVMHEREIEKLQACQEHRGERE